MQTQRDAKRSLVFVLVPEWLQPTLMDQVEAKGVYSIQVSHMVAEAQVPSLGSTAIPGALTGGWYINGVVRTWTGTPAGDARGSRVSGCTIMLAPWYFHNLLMIYPFNVILNTYFQFWSLSSFKIIDVLNNPSNYIGHASASVITFIEILKMIKEILKRKNPHNLLLKNFPSETYILFHYVFS